MGTPLRPRTSTDAPAQDTSSTAASAAERKGLRRGPWRSAKQQTLRRTEKQFQAQVEQFAETLGWFCFHLYNARQSKAGFPDLMLVKDRVVWMELKVYYDNGRAGRVMGEQERFHEMLRAAGQEVYVIFDDEDGWEVIKRVLSDGRLT